MKKYSSPKLLIVDTDIKDVICSSPIETETQWFTFDEGTDNF